MSETVQTVIVLLIIAVAVAGLVWLLRNRKADPGCGDCPLSDTCKKPENRRKNGKC